MPRWLNEGLAQLYETALVEGDDVRIACPDPERLKRARAANDLVPLKDLLHSGPKQFVVAHASDKETSDRYYLTSWALALYLASDGTVLGTKKLDDYCRATPRRGRPPRRVRRPGRDEAGRPGEVRGEVSGVCPEAAPNRPK